MNEFGELLYSLRKESGMTQAELAQKLGVTNKAVSKWETGEAMPEAALLLPIARIFDVSVDELLNGRRADKQAPADESRAESVPSFDEASKHLFTRGKDDGPKTKADLVCMCICASVFLLGVLSYLIVGVCTEKWHPYWIIAAISPLCCGIVGVLFELFSPVKRSAKLAHGENPYTGGICGLIMLCGIIAYLCLGAFGGYWHPHWIIVVGSALVCGVVGTVGKAALGGKGDDQKNRKR